MGGAASDGAATVRGIARFTSERDAVAQRGRSFLSATADQRAADARPGERLVGPGHGAICGWPLIRLDGALAGSIPASIETEATERPAPTPGKSEACLVRTEEPSTRPNAPRPNSTPSPVAPAQSRPIGRHPAAAEW